MHTSYTYTLIYILIHISIYMPLHTYTHIDILGVFVQEVPLHPRTYRHSRVAVQVSWVRVSSDIHSSTSSACFCYARACIHTYVHIHISLYTQTYICMWLCVCACIYVCMYMHACMHACIAISTFSYAFPHMVYVHLAHTNTITHTL